MNVEKRKLRKVLHLLYETHSLIDDIAGLEEEATELWSKQLLSCKDGIQAIGERVIDLTNQKYPKTFK